MGGWGSGRGRPAETPPAITVHSMCDGYNAMDCWHRGDHSAGTGHGMVKQWPQSRCGRRPTG